MTYASYARGYKGQAFDIGGGKFSEYAANNLFDKAYASNKINLTQLFAPGLTIGQVLPRSAQRYVGVQARYNF